MQNYSQKTIKDILLNYLLVGSVLMTVVKLGCK